jgi:tetratricopeptide (TPR) repeat protein
MPLIFRYSKININTSLRTIKSGIPLRVFDILGAGGFLITNYQSDIADYFEIGEDLVCYESEADLVEKVGYYLVHEEERKRIATNGYRKVKQFHNYEVRLKEIFRIVSEKPAADPQVPIRIDTDTTGIIQLIGEFVWEGRIEEAKQEYFTLHRSQPDMGSDPIFEELDMIFHIYAYELIRDQNTIFEHSKELKKVLRHYNHLKWLLLRLEESNTNENRTEEELALVHYVEANQVSYTAMEFIINHFSGHKVELLNRVAWAFYDADRKEMVLPFLSLAIELEPKDDTTLAHLAHILYRLGEYQMAYDYINEISIASPETMELMENILKYI